MLDKMTENMKFFLMLLVYTVTLTWWASDINSNVTYNTQQSNKIAQILDIHLEECNKKDTEIIKLTYEIKSLRHEIQELKEKIGK